jgi:hypothetical protein
MTIFDPQKYGGGPKAARVSISGQSVPGYHCSNVLLNRWAVHSEHPCVLWNNSADKDTKFFSAGKPLVEVSLGRRSKFDAAAS